MTGRAPPAILPPAGPGAGGGGPAAVRGFVANGRGPDWAMPPQGVAVRRRLGRPPRRLEDGYPEGRLAGLTVVTTDLFPELVDWIRAGKVAATVYQRPLAQGRIAVQSICQYLQTRRRPASNQRVVPYLVMRSNLDVALERLSGDRQNFTRTP